MKTLIYNWFIISFMCLIALSAHAQSKTDVASNKIILHGDVSGVKDSIKYVYANLLNKETDSAKVINGKYHFEWTTNVPLFITLMCKSPNVFAKDTYASKNITVFMAEPSNILVSSIDSFSNLKITGSKAYIEWSNVETSQAAFRKQLSILLKKSARYQSGTNNNDDAYKLNLEIDSIEKIISHNYFQYVKDNPETLIGIYCIARYSRNMMSEDIATVEKFYDNLNDEEKNSAEGRQIRAYLRALEIKVGGKAPDFTVNDINGKNVSLSSTKGKLILLDFWASWCVPCREETPHLVKLYNEYKSKGLEIFSFSLDDEDSKDKWKEAVKKDKMTWINVSDLKGFQGSIAKQYKLLKVPTNFLIDASGKIIAKDIHEAILEKTIKDYLNKQ